MPGPPGTRFRLGVLGVAAVALLATLLARMWYLQVIAADELRVASERNRVRTVREEAPRGRILDRHGRVIVDNRQVSVVAIDRRIFDTLDGDTRARVLGDLAGVLGTTVDDLRERIADERFSRFAPVPVADDVDDRVLVELRERQDDFPGVVAEQRTVRAYPYGSLAAHILGYVGEINDTELSEHAGNPEYRLGVDIGKAGVERTYDAQLRGVAGTRHLEVDARGRVLRTLSVTPPVAGHDLVLSIDLDLQAHLERVLAEGIEAARARRDDDGRPFAAPAGSAVVLDPRTGEVLAMASYPTFEPGDFVNGISTSQWDALNDPEGHFPLNNRAIQGQYAPGSTFKLITALAALRTGLIGPDTTIVDRGTFEIERCQGTRCRYRNAQGRSYGTVDVRRALTVSSDVFFYRIGAAFWEQRDTYGDAIQAAATDFGFGGPTGIPLPSEQSGLVPTPENRRARHEANPEAFPEGNWYTGHNVILAIGQGDMAATPLQLANAYAAFAVGGVLHAPNIATGVRATDGTLVEALEPRRVRTVPIDPVHHRVVEEGLEGVVSTSEGTAASAFAGFDTRAFPVAGKTGTAEVAGRQDTSLFVAYGPVGDPRYVVAAVIEEAGFGSAVAAPLVRRVFDVLAGFEPLRPAVLVEPPPAARCVHPDDLGRPDVPGDAVPCAGVDPLGPLPPPDAGERAAPEAP